ncbi:MAG: 50S ribosomal protein L25 [Candidatus Vogelbacteria bacterium]|nr:50S ribosomal protein L25 [Candidatus Vogelbacteria bacterium]
MMLKLNAKLRTAFGKKTQSLRETGLVPAVVYGGKNKETQSITLDLPEFKKVLIKAGESTIISLEVEGNKGQDVLIHEVQSDPLSGFPIHVDFYVVSQDKELEVAVPLVFEGVSPAVKDLGGSLVKVLHELEIRALPKNLPHDITVDISTLTNLDSQILIKDLKLPAGVESVLDIEEVVAAITEAGEEVIEETAPVDLSAIEVEKKGKQEEPAEEPETSAT